MQDALKLFNHEILFDRRSGKISSEESFLDLGHRK